MMVDAGMQGFFNVRQVFPAFRVEGVIFCGKQMSLDMEDSIYRIDIIEGVRRVLHL